jgi:hypothetical protein
VEADGEVGQLDLVAVEQLDRKPAEEHEAGAAVEDIDNAGERGTQRRQRDIVGAERDDRSPGRLGCPGGGGELFALDVGQLDRP